MFTAFMLISYTFWSLFIFKTDVFTLLFKISLLPVLHNMENEKPSEMKPDKDAFLLQERNRILKNTRRARTCTPILTGGM